MAQSDLSNERASGTLSDRQAELIERFVRRFERDASAAVEELQTNVASGLVDRMVAIESLFEQYFLCPMRWQDVTARAILLLADPSEIAPMVLRLYGEIGGGQRLDALSALMEKAGKCSWPALTELIEAERPECESFVSTIAFLKGVSLDDRITALSHSA